MARKIENTTKDFIGDVLTPLLSLPKEKGYETFIIDIADDKDYTLEDVKKLNVAFGRSLSAICNNSSLRYFNTGYVKHLYINENKEGRLTFSFKTILTFKPDETPRYDKYVNAPYLIQFLSRSVSHNFKTYFDEHYKGRLDIKAESVGTPNAKELMNIVGKTFGDINDTTDQVPVKHVKIFSVGKEFNDLHKTLPTYQKVASKATNELESKWIQNGIAKVQPKQMQLHILGSQKVKYYNKNNDIQTRAVKQMNGLSSIEEYARRGEIQFAMKKLVKFSNEFNLKEVTNEQNERVLVKGAKIEREEWYKRTNVYIGSSLHDLISDALSESESMLSSKKLIGNETYLKDFMDNIEPKGYYYGKKTTIDATRFTLEVRNLKLEDVQRTIYNELSNIHYLPFDAQYSKQLELEREEEMKMYDNEEVGVDFD